MVRSDVGYTVALWAEIIFHGRVVGLLAQSPLNITFLAIYTCLFGYSVCLMLNTRSRLRKGAPSSVFLIVTLLMYIVATFHLFVQLYRYLRAFILGVDPHGYLSYMQDLQRWDKGASHASVATMAWLGDGLMIYRCYLVWNSKPWVVVAPILLLSCSIGINIVVLTWFGHPSIVSRMVAQTLLNAIYPLAFIRTVMVTALIASKIWKQHRSSSASGVVDRGSRLSLRRLVLIVIESAMLYTLQLLLLIILYLLKSDFQIIVQLSGVPTIGLAFVLITVRVHAAKSQPASTLPGWSDANSNSRSHLEILGQRASEKT